MKHLLITDTRIAGHCTSGTSNKVWIACVAVESSELAETAQPVELAMVPATTEVVFLSAHGPYGAALRLETPKRMGRQDAQKLFHKKWQEKAGKGYAVVAFEPFLSALGKPEGLPLLLPEAAPVPPKASAPSAPSTSLETSSDTSLSPFRHTAALVKAVTFDQMMERLKAGSTISEKANGERCLLEFDGIQIRAYNRKGRLVSAPPEGAEALRRLGQPWVVDGERLTREQAGHYVLFDVLEWNGEDLTALAYRRRLTRLVRAMHSAGLLKEPCLTPTIAQARRNSVISHLCVLLGVQGMVPAQSVLQEIQGAGGEGVIIRSLDAPYATGGFKYKFLEDIDVFVIGIEPGVSEGSLILGMVRSSDGAIVEVGRVRAGLNDTDIQRVRGMLLRGEHPVFRVTYLPASTIGIALVQPKTSMDALRTDKAASECTTDQFGPEKAVPIERARPVVGLRVQ